jgi:DNA-binding XRE family transcriptional regulator
MEMEVATLKEFIGTLPKQEQRKIAARARTLVAEEMSLREVRKAVGKTQVAVAKRLKVGQDAVSKLESRSDMYLSTLRGFVEAMGGELELVARFPNRPPVRLEELGTSGAPRRRNKSAA